MTAFAPETLALLFLLGMRHGLDPDHVAVIDNITFRALDDRPRAAAWTGVLFSAGHTISVLAIAAAFGVLGAMVRLPQAFETAMAVFVIGLFVVTGTLNLRALTAKGAYVPRGWRHGLVPKILRGSTHPLVTLGIGLVFGLVVDTAAQIAAWGTTAAATGGIAGALAIGLSFALGMILTDGIDSLIVTRLASDRHDAVRARRYRRGVGWLIVALSYAMAAWALAQLLAPDLDVPTLTGVAFGAAMALAVIATAALSLLRRRS